MVTGRSWRAASIFLFLTGGALIAVGAVVATLPSALSTAGVYLFVLGVALLLVVVAVNLPALLRTRWQRLVDLAEAVLFSGLVALCLLAVNRIVVDHNIRRDFTIDRLFTLTPQTRGVLARLTTPVRVSAFLSRRDPRVEYARALLREYKELSRLVQVQVLDPQERPSEASRLGVTGGAMIVLESGGRTVRVRTLEEAYLTAGFQRLSSPSLTVGFIVGHQERDVRSAGRDQLGGLVDILEMENMEPERFRLTDHPEIPDRLAAIVLAGPRTDLTIEELERIERFLAKGRGVVITLELAADPQPNLERFLLRWGLAVPRGIVVDMKSHSKNDAGTLIVSRLAQHPTTRGVLGLVFSGARPVLPIKEGPSDAKAEPLAESTEQSWAEMDAPNEYRPTAGRDPMGPVSVAVAVTTKTKGRLLAVGNTLFATDLFLGVLNNRDFLIQGLAWVAETSELPAIFTDPHANRLMMLSHDVFQVTGAIVCIGMPMVTALIGVFLFLHRR